MVEHELPKPEARSPEATDQAEPSLNGTADTEASLPPLNLRAPKSVPEGFVEVKEPNEDDGYDSYSDFEDGGIKGVYIKDDEGGLVELEDADQDSE